jgi:hypothetical protein
MISVGKRQSQTFETQRNGGNGGFEKLKDCGSLEHLEAGRRYLQVFCSPLLTPFLCVSGFELKLIDDLREFVEPRFAFDPFGGAHGALGKADARFCVMGKEDRVIG